MISIEAYRAAIGKYNNHFKMKSNHFNQAHQIYSLLWLFIIFYESSVGPVKRTCFFVKAIFFRLFSTFFRRNPNFYMKDWFKHTKPLHFLNLHSISTCNSMFVQELTNNCTSNFVDFL